MGGIWANGRRSADGVARRARLFASTAIALCCFAAADPAMAACSDTAPSDGETVTCDGASAVGVVASSADDVTLNVLDNATITPPSGPSIWLGTGAEVGIGAGAIVGNSATTAYAVQLGSGGELTLDGTITGGGGIHGATTVFPDGLVNSTITISETGQILVNGLGQAGIVGRGGGNTYNIDGLIHTSASSNDGIIVGAGDVLNLGATGQIITLSGDSTSPVGGFEADNVTVTTAAGSLIELHGLAAGIDLGANATVTLGGLIRSYGDTYPQVNSAGGAGVGVGPNSTVTLLEGGQIITGNTLGQSNQGRGANGISTFYFDGPSNSEVFVHGLIDTQRALGIFSGVGDKITVGATGRITTRLTSNAIFANLNTSTTDYQWTLDISGTVEQLGTGRALFLSASGADGEVVETQAQAFITIHEGGTLYAAANQAYGQDDGCCGFPEVIDTMVVAGRVARGTAGTVIDLNDGADKITFLPTYQLTGNVNGGSDAVGAPETDTFALDGAMGTTATFNFGANQISNFEAGQKLGAGSWTLTGTTTGLNGLFAVDAGTLRVDGTMTNTGAAIASGAALGGGGVLTGAVTVADGGRLLGAAGADLATGALTFNEASLLDIALGAPSATALFNVTGALTLDGRLIVSDAGGFGEGSYRLIDYSGALTNNFLVIQSVPSGYNPGDWNIDTGTAGQVTLIVAQGANTQYWEGSNMSPGSVANGRGGSGVWNAANTNWTNQAGTINAAWAAGNAVFNSAPGTSTVEVVGEQAVAGMQFLAPDAGDNGYVFTAGAGGALAIAGADTVFDVAGDFGGSVTEAAIGVQIRGAGGLLKAGSGDLVLSTANTYSGGTEVDAGQLVASATGALSNGPVTVDAGGLTFSGAGTSAGSLAIANASADAGGGVAFLSGTSAGGATITNTGLVRFAGTANATGATIVNQAGGVVDVSERDGVDELNIGSLSGGGTVRLGDQTLTLGALDADDTISGVIENGAAAVNGTNQLVKTGSGTLTLSGANTYTGFTTVREGTLLVDGTVADGGLGVYSGRLGGSGTIGGDVFVLDGATLLGRAGADLSMASLTLANASFVEVALGAPSDAALFDVVGALTLDGRLVVTDAGGFGLGTYRLIDYGGTLTNNGLVIQTLPAGFNPGDWDIDTTVSGQVSLIVAQSSGTQYWDGSHMSPGSVANGRGGSGVWNAANTNWTNQAGTINAPWASGNAVFAAAGASTVTIEGAQSFTGLRFLSGADYDFVAGTGGGLTADGSAQIALEGAATTVSIAVSIGGSGGVVKAGDGTLTLSGANTYVGGTVIQDGVLEVTANGALGTATGEVVFDGGTLRLAAAMSSARELVVSGGGSLDTGAHVVTLSGDLTGSGDLTRLGSGTLTYSGDGSAYSGTLFLEGGTLALTGSLGGTLEVGDGAELGGTGTMADLVVKAGGVLAPGSSIGTLTATGDVTFHAGSFFELEIEADGGTDLLAASGSATLEGGTVRIATLDPDTDYTDGERYTFLTAGGGLIGEFSGIEEHSAFLDFTLGYDNDSAFVDLEVVRSFPDVALTFNQLQSSGVLAEFDVPGDSRTVYNALLMQDADDARAAFDAASGEIYAVAMASAVRQADEQGQHLLRQAQTQTAEGWNLWGLVAGQQGHVESDGNGARYTHDRIGGMLGVGYGGPENGWAVGLGAGYWGGEVDLPGRASEAQAEGWQLGGYARVGTGGAGFTAVVSANYAIAETKVRRTVAIGALSRETAADPDLDSWALAGEARFGFALGADAAIGPIARLSYAESSLDRFAEAGADSLDLTGLAGNGTDRTRLGGGVFARWTGETAGIELQTLYSRANNDPSEALLELAGAPNAGFHVRAARGSRDFAELGASAHVDVGSAVTLAIGAGALLGADEQAISGNAEIRWAF